ncbi:MAG: hypothetical protein Q4B14_06370, partial [Clostridia bacterium]|nr:hypothetical protein [Clostridia bacterium]
LINAMSSLLLTIAVTRIFGNGEDSDIFSIAYSTALMLSTLGLFEARQFQTSDVKGEYKFSEYLSMRYLTCMLMILFIGIFIIINGYNIEKAAVMFLITLYMAIGALEDVYQGFFQLKGRLDLAGKSLFIRILVSMIFFFVTVILTENLVFSSVMLCVGSLIIFLGYDVVTQIKMTDKIIFPRFNFRRIKKLIMECLPLCICSFLSIYTLNAPKYSIDDIFYNEVGIQTIFTILVMPAAAINLLSIFVFRPAMTPLANSFYSKDITGFKKIIKRLVSWIGIVMVVCVLLGYLFGTQVLSLIYGVDVTEYVLSLVLILIGGGVSALLSLLQYIITIMRKQYRLLIGYILSGVFAYFVSNYMVANYEILGGAISYLSTYIFTAICFFIVLTYYWKKLVK